MHACVGYFAKVLKKVEGLEWVVQGSCRGYETG